MIQSPRLPKPFPASEPEAFAHHAHLFQTTLTGDDQSNIHAPGLIIEQVKARKVQLMRSNLPGFRLVDSHFELCELSGSEWEKAFFRRVVVKDCRLLGTQIFEGIFKDVEFINCQAEGISFVSAKFKHCRFNKCKLNKATFDGADVSGVVFHECNLTEANFHQAKLKRTDFRTSQIDGLSVGVTEMQGAIIAPIQALQVVGLLGVQVKEIDQPDND